ncbi:MAG: hypothetical protein F6K50_24620 [Moorea sp. SIO3I7]|uniref:hypothetical protein n=1 Tax=Moorena sp. SIO3I8 TaxID=2607833 RepID=UPI0013C071B2|nr:hypothetical protein [Moorena sp. SIO3I8]NEN98578.1 hypothetical protein [Moorena sp. SIO3I7]NEO04401.1 hypothetical protein [Moorena sp. SIO3I8]
MKLVYSVSYTYQVHSIFLPRLPTADSLLPTPYSLLPTPYSLLPTPYSLLPTAINPGRKSLT